MKAKAIFFVLLLIAAAAVAAAAPQAQTIPEAEKEAIIRAALDYGDGFYSGSAERMERAIHPDLNKVYVATIPQTGKHLLGYSTYSGLIEMSRAKVGLTDPEKRKITGYALRLNGDIACAKITSAQYNDFLQMVKFDGRWKIVNVLWVPGPDSPNRPPMPAYDPAKDDTAILAAAADFAEGSMSGDAARMEKVFHPEVNAAVVVQYPGGKTGISRGRYSAVVEPIRAKLRVVPVADRKADYRIIDVMDGMAFVEIAAANGLHYVQMALIDGQWKIINILTRRAAPPAPAKK